jgi:hypothetical protein
VRFGFVERIENGDGGLVDANVGVQVHFHFSGTSGRQKRNCHKSLSTSPASFYHLFQSQGSAIAGKVE